ncbi:uncharacterized protein BO97DRAFT_430191 [Aspergillus homomorphus CBS 101889]|uniref:Uncharacterized protein n=1 Tax=Aspergillus homomorphus (strain CBS 101889) TaxID=1450537 RepID=A0A395HF04_ASPHC|nr:hypothetical protein BO97DRAFT_430191 [Aspergillus homomorphus CBS 101889]RAL06462.1 hypothetical protein BO97DRAFT_430191 [Aspergillus homomorphus CBS 101889]
MPRTGTTHPPASFDTPKNVRIIDRSFSITCRSEKGPSFFVGNLDAVVEKLDEWNTQLPFVKPFYGSSIDDPLVHDYGLNLIADNLLSC